MMIDINIYDGIEKVATIKANGELIFHTTILTSDNLREIASILDKYTK